MVGCFFLLLFRVNCFLCTLSYCSISFQTNLINLKCMSPSVVFAKKKTYYLDSGLVKTVCNQFFSKGDCIHFLDNNTLISIKDLALLQHSFDPKRDLTILLKIKRWSKKIFRCLWYF